MALRSHWMICAGYEKAITSFKYFKQNLDSSDLVLMALLKPQQGILLESMGAQI